MAAIDEINLQPILATTNDAQAIKSFFRAELWEYYHEHKDDEIKTVNFWFIHRTIYVRDFYGFLLLFLGPEL